MRRKFLFDNLPRTAIAGAISEWVHVKRDRDILTAVYLDGDTDEAAAEKFGVSPSTVRRVRLRGGELIEARTLFDG